MMVSNRSLTISAEISPMEADPGAIMVITASYRTPSIPTGRESGHISPGSSISLQFIVSGTHCDKTEKGTPIIKKEMIKTNRNLCNSPPLVNQIYKFQYFYQTLRITLKLNIIVKY